MCMHYTVFMENLNESINLLYSWFAQSSTKSMYFVKRWKVVFFSWV